MKTIKNLISKIWHKFLLLKRWQQVIVIVVIIGIYAGSPKESTTSSDTVSTTSVAAQGITSPTPLPADSSGQVDEPSASPSSVAVEDQPSATASPRTPKLNQIAYDGKFAFTVTKVQCGIQKVGSGSFSATAQGQYCAITLTVRNDGNESQTMFSSNQYLYDKRGRKFEVDSSAELWADTTEVSWEKINPGNSVKGTIYFDVPDGIKLDYLEVHDSMFSFGTEIYLN